MLKHRINPILNMDYPDPDVIRVDNVYYMVSTTMHFFPGGSLLKSYDLVNWEIAGYLFDKLDDIPGERLERELVDYGGGMWAPCIRYQNGKFYVIFGSHTGEGRTYLFTSDSIEGPWERTEFEKYYHDCSLLFDNGKVYLVYGNSEIEIQEMKEDLSGPKEDGLHRVIIREKDDVILGYEGSHIYKIDDYYYVFLIHWPRGGIRTQACFRSKVLDAEFEGKDILSDDSGFPGKGAAQGGVVMTPAGVWYSVLFRDMDAVGRIPVLAPMTWEEGWPIIGKNGRIPDRFEIPKSSSKVIPEPLFISDDFLRGGRTFAKQWQWNHQPDNKHWYFHPKGGLVISTSKLAINLTHATNVLTQRMMYPQCGASVIVDATDLNNGDIAGICALQSCYGLIGIAKDGGSYYLMKIVRTPENLKHGPKLGDCMPGEILEKVRLEGPQVKLMLKADFTDGKDLLSFFYEENGQMIRFGEEHKMQFRLDHFVGNRFGLFVYATKEIGGKAMFREFVYLDA